MSNIERCDVFIDGKVREPLSGTYSSRENPATEKPWAEIPDGGPEDIDAAVRAAERAFPRWSGIPPTERAKYLLRIAQSLSDNSDLHDCCYNVLLIYEKYPMEDAPQALEKTSFPV